MICRVPSVTPNLDFKVTDLQSCYRRPWRTVCTASTRYVCDS